MKNRPLFRLIIILAGILILGVRAQNASAFFREQSNVIKQSASDQQAVGTPIPTVSPFGAVTEIPESRQLPPVGNNAGLVIGASVLVLIIVGGVLGSRRRQNH